MPKKALITGITGQDGSYLSEFLLSKKYKVHGLVRRVALEDKTHRLWRLRNILNKVNLHAASLESYASIVKLIQKLKPTEIYHLGAQSYIDYAFKDEFSTRLILKNSKNKYNNFGCKYDVVYSKFDVKKFLPLSICSFNLLAFKK